MAPTENLLFSGFNVSEAFQLLYVGSVGGVKAELDDLYTQDMVRTRGDQDLSQVPDAYKALNDLLSFDSKDEDATKIYRAASLWVNEGQGYHFSKNYLDRLQKLRIFPEQVNYALDFKKPETLKQMNDWVSNATDRLIPTILESLDPAMVSLLISSLFIQGPWLYSFEEHATQESDFNINSKKKIKLPFMNQEKFHPYVESEELQAIQLLTKDRKFALEIYLPRTDVGADELREALGEDFDIWSTVDFRNAHYVSLSLPKSKISFNRDILKDLGSFIPETLSGGTDLSGLLTPAAELGVSAVIHKTVLEMNESGFKAAAVTAIGLEKTSAKPQIEAAMIVNRPFGLRIVHLPTKLELFRGWVAQPEALTN